MVFVKADCPPGFLRGLTEADCYKIVSIGYYFNDGESQCREYGGHLASIGSAFVNTFLKDTVYETYNGGVTIWIGAERSSSKNVWSWTDGGNFSYSNWAKGEPGSGGNCAYLDVATGLWVAYNCATARYLLCRVPPLSPKTTAWRVQVGYLDEVGRYDDTTRQYLAKAACDSGWTHFAQTKSCYKIIHNYVTCEKAEQLCNAEGAHLASIHNDAENSMLVDWAETGQPVYSWYNQTWIGLIRKDVPGEFQWTDGTPVDYVNWMQGKPSISPSSCVGLCTDEFVPGTGSGRPDKYTWFDDWLSEIKRASICQKPAR